MTMYNLTLTSEERKAIDWIGNRYATGYELYHLLFVRCEQSPEEDWDFDGDLTFMIPEYVAWEIQDLAEQEGNLWPCFADEFKQKMISFIDSII